MDFADACKKTLFVSSFFLLAYNFLCRNDKGSI